MNSLSSQTQTVDLQRITSEIARSRATINEPNVQIVDLDAQIYRLEQYIWYTCTVGKDRFYWQIHNDIADCLIIQIPELNEFNEEIDQQCTGIIYVNDPDIAIEDRSDQTPDKYVWYELYEYAAWWILDDLENCCLIPMQETDPTFQALLEQAKTCGVYPINKK